MTSIKPDRIVLYLLTFIMGGCGIAYEYTLSKLSGDLLGSSVVQWAVIIGLMMFFMGVGSDLQKYISDRNLFDRFVSIEIIQGLLGGFGPLLLLFTFGHARDYYTLLQYTLISLIGLIIGLEIPLLMRINHSYSRSLKVNIGGILRMDYIGAFAGALTWLLLLVPVFSIPRTGLILGGLNITVSGLAFIYFHRYAHHKRSLGTALVIAVIAVTAGLIFTPDLTVRAEQALYRDRIIYRRTTAYQHIVLTRSPSDNIYCYINGNLQFSGRDEYIYHECLVHPAMHAAQKRERVLVLGGGDGLAVREILKYPEVNEITLVDIDPEMTRIARQQPDLVRLNRGSLKNARVHTAKAAAFSPGQRTPVTTVDRTARFYRTVDEPAPAQVHLYHIDADRFLDNVSQYYDVIIIDFPDPNTPNLSKLYSRRFYARARESLARGGVLVQQGSSPTLVKESFLTIGRTMRAAGLAAVPYHRNVPTFGDWGFWLARHGGPADETSLRQDLRSLTAITVPARHLTPDVLRASLIFGKNVLTAKKQEINTILNNAVYKYYREGLKKSRN